MQFMMGPRPRCYIPSFMKIGPAVPDKKIFKGFYHIWARRPSWLCDLDRPGVPRSKSLNAPYLKEQEYIWFMGGDLNGFYYAFYEKKGVGHTLGGPPGVPISMSLNVPYHKEQEYIWFREGILNPKSVIMHFHVFAYKCLCDQI